MRSFLFDVGNVILFFDFSVAVRRVAAQCSLAEDSILPALADLTVELELGQLEVDAFTRTTIERIGFRGEAEQLIRALEDIFTLNEPMANLIEDLKAKSHPLYLLSNTNAIHVPFFTSRYPVFENFSGAIYSHEVGAMKPDPAIFQAASEQLDLDPTNTIYIDDLADNIAAGAAHGYRAIHYSGDAHADFLDELADLGDLPSEG